MTEMPQRPDDDPSRRRFVEACIVGMGVASAGAVTYPVVAFLGRPASVRAAQAVRVALGDLGEDQARYVEWQGQQVAIVNTGGTPKVLSASCSHLGCLVSWDNLKRVFHCPCHGAVFDDQGKPLSGPVSQPLTSIPFQVVDGHVVIG